jgi:hypothetical protein
VPFPKQKRPQAGQAAEGNDNEDAESDVSDNMSDLYPDEMFDVIKEDLEEFESKKKSKNKRGDETEEMDYMDDEESGEQAMGNNDVESEDDGNSNVKSKNVKRKLDSKVSPKEAKKHFEPYKSLYFL